MNIDRVNGYGDPKQLSRGPKAVDVKGFERVLKDAVESVLHEEYVPGEVSPVKGVGLPHLRPLHTDRLVLQQAYTVLDLLEEYSEALNNPDKTLKGIEPVVKRIGYELKGLDVQLRDDSGQNDDLVSIVNDIAVTASVEAFKFQRGDYVA